MLSKKKNKHNLLVFALTMEWLFTQVVIWFLTSGDGIRCFVICCWGWNIPLIKNEFMLLREVWSLNFHYEPQQEFRHWNKLGVYEFLSCFGSFHGFFLSEKREVLLEHPLMLVICRAILKPPLKQLDVIMR